MKTLPINPIHLKTDPNAVTRIDQAIEILKDQLWKMVDGTVGPFDSTSDNLNHIVATGEIASTIKKLKEARDLAVKVSDSVTFEQVCKS